MDLKQLFTKEKEIWHDRFIPSLIAGIAVALIAFFFEFNEGNIVMFASVGASAVILTHRTRVHLTKLKTVLLSYILTSGTSLLVFYISSIFAMPLQVRILIAVTFSSLFLYSFNVFHPPAISAGVSFLIFHRPTSELLALVLSVLILFIVIRLSMYIFSQKFTFKEFLYEFLHEEYVKIIHKNDKKEK